MTETLGSRSAPGLDWVTRHVEGAQILAQWQTPTSATFDAMPFDEIVKRVEGPGPDVAVRSPQPVNPVLALACRRRQGDLVNALRGEKLLTVGAGDNVVRFLAPLIVTEAEIDESVQMLERACVALSGNQLKKAAG